MFSRRVSFPGRRFGWNFEDYFMVPNNETHHSGVHSNGHLPKKRLIHKHYQCFYLYLEYWFIGMICGLFVSLFATRKQISGFELGGETYLRFIQEPNPSDTLHLHIPTWYFQAHNCLSSHQARIPRGKKNTWFTSRSGRDKSLSTSHTYQLTYSPPQYDPNTSDHYLLSCSLVSNCRKLTLRPKIPKPLAAVPLPGPPGPLLPLTTQPMPLPWPAPSHWLSCWASPAPSTPSPVSPPSAVWQSC